MSKQDDKCDANRCRHEYDVCVLGVCLCKEHWKKYCQRELAVAGRRYLRKVSGISPRSMRDRKEGGQCTGRSYASSNEETQREAL